MNQNIVNVNRGIAGYFKLRKGIINEDGSETITGETGWFNNLITDAGMNMIASAVDTSNNPMSAVQVGTGSTTPSFSDTTLANYLVGTATDSPSGTGQGFGQVVGPPRYGWRRIAKRFGQGVAAGNLTEIGISQSTNTTLFSRALILDGSGNPTTLTVLSTEFLDVLYELRLYMPVNDVTTTATISSIVYDLIIRPASFAENRAWAEGLPCPKLSWVSGHGPSMGVSSLTPPAIGGTPNNNLQSYIEATPLSYISGNFYRDWQLTWGISQANGNIKYISFQSGIGCFMYIFDPVIPKDNTKNLVLTLRLSWSRYTP